jgi:response regulator of citrate/malate metabolism
VILDVYLRISRASTSSRKPGVWNQDGLILITAAHDAHTVEDSMRFGVYDYIIKPFEFERFKEALRNTDAVGNPGAGGFWIKADWIK